MKIAVTAALIAAAAIAAAACTSTPAAKVSSVNSATPAATTATPLAPPTPNPEGTYLGSCDYTLSDNMNSSNAGTLIGEMDVKNTGNIGTITRARITWPQEGFEPITATRTVRVPFGTSRAIRFHVPASQNVIAELQSWQERHNMRDGCTYHATVTGTFGAAH